MMLDGATISSSATYYRPVVYSTAAKFVIKKPPLKRITAYVEKDGDAWLVTSPDLPGLIVETYEREGLEELVMELVSSLLKLSAPRPPRFKLNLLWR